MQPLQLVTDPTHSWVFILFTWTRVVSETALRLFLTLPNPLLASRSHSQVPGGAVLPMMCHHHGIRVIQHGMCRGKVIFQSAQPSQDDVKESGSEVYKDHHQNKIVLVFLW